MRDTDCPQDCTRGRRRYTLTVAFDDPLGDEDATVALEHIAAMVDREAKRIPDIIPPYVTSFVAGDCERDRDDCERERADNARADADDARYDAAVGK